MSYPGRYKRLLNVEDPVIDQFRSGIEFQYFVFPKSVRNGESNRTGRRSSDEHLFEAIIFALKKRMVVGDFNLDKYKGKTAFAPVLYQTVRDKLPKKIRKSLLLFCCFGTAFDLWNRTDMFFMLGDSIIRIDLTLNQFRDEPKEYGGKTYVFTRYHLVGSGLNDISRQIAESLKDGEGKINSMLAKKIRSVVNRWIGYKCETTSFAG